MTFLSYSVTMMFHFKVVYSCKMQIALINIRGSFFLFWVSMNRCLKFICFSVCMHTHIHTHTHNIIDYLILPSQPLYSFSVFCLFLLFHVVLNCILFCIWVSYSWKISNYTLRKIRIDKWKRCHIIKIIKISSPYK